jgi:hypothetical protein
MACKHGKRLRDCKICDPERYAAVQAYQKAYREANRDEKLAYVKAYREANREAISAQKREYYKANREAISARKKAWHEANRDVVRARNKAYREANRDRLHAVAKAYRRRPEVAIAKYKKGAQSRGHCWDLTDAQAAWLMQQPCAYCGEAGGGIDRAKNEYGYTVLNSVPCCTTCNFTKLKATVKAFIVAVNAVARYCPDYPRFKRRWESIRKKLTRLGESNAFVPVHLYRVPRNPGKTPDVRRVPAPAMVLVWGATRSYSRCPCLVPVREIWKAERRYDGARPMNCENCGLPPGATHDPGRTFEITKRALNAFHRDRKATVWACSDECAIQALGVAKYGSATHRWPITLAQFRATRPLEPNKPVRRRVSKVCSGKGKRPHSRRQVGRLAR